MITTSGILWCDHRSINIPISGYNLSQIGPRQVAAAVKSQRKRFEWTVRRIISTLISAVGTPKWIYAGHIYPNCSPCVAVALIQQLQPETLKNRIQAKKIIIQDSPSRERIPWMEQIQISSACYPHQNTNGTRWTANPCS